MGIKEDTDFESYSSEMARGTIWSLLGNGMDKVLSFIIIIYIARVVAASDVGLFYLTISIMSLFAAWKTFGLPASLIRFVPFYEARKREGKITELVRLTYAINLVSGLILTALAYASADWVGAFFNNPGLPDAMRFMSFFMLLDNIFSIHLSYLQGRVNIKFMQITTILQTLFQLVFTVALFTVYGPTLAALAGAFLLSYLFAAILSAKPVLQSMARALPTGQKGDVLTSDEFVSKIVPFGITLTILQALWAIVSYTGQVMLGYFLPQSSANSLLAVYSLAIIMAGNVMVFPSTVGGIFLPMISRLVSKGDMKSVRRILASAQRWVLFITLPFVAVMIVFSYEMLATFYKSSYSTGALTDAIFCAGLVFSVFAYVFTLALAGMRRVDIEFKIAVACVLANALLCLILIPPFGMNGAAVACAASFALAAGLFSYYTAKIIKFRTPVATYRIIAAGLVAFLAVWLAKPYVTAIASSMPHIGGAAFSPYIAKLLYLLLLGVVTGFSFAVFLACVIILRCFGREDMLPLKIIARKLRVPQGYVAIAERVFLMGLYERE